MKILLIANYADSLIRFRGALIDELLRRGLTVHVAAPDLVRDSGTRRALAAKGATVHKIPLDRTGTNPWRDLYLLGHLWALMRRLRPDLMLAYTVKPVVYGLLAARLARVPRRFALITGLGYAFDDTRQGSTISRIVQNLYRLALRGAHRVFFQNPDDENLFRTRRILPLVAPSTVINGSGVDIEAFQVVPLPERPSFLLMARLLRAKGIYEYATAAQRIRTVHPEAIFRLAGWIDDNPDAIRQEDLDRWIADGTLEYLGQLRDVRHAITEASVYVLPSYREGTPRSVLEAMAMGRAIITTDAPGCRETVIPGKNGFLVPARSVDALVEAMQRFIEEPTLARAMGQRSRQLAEEKYDVRQVNARMLEGMGLG